MVGSVGQSHHKMCSGHLKFNLATQNIGVRESTKQVISRGRLHLHRGEIASSPRVQEGSPWVLPCFTGPQAKGGTLCTVEPYKWFAKLNWDGHYARWDFHQWRLERGASQAEEPKDHCFRTRDLQDIGHRPVGRESWVQDTNHVCCLGWAIPVCMVPAHI